MSQLKLPIKVKVKHRGFWVHRTEKYDLNETQGYDHGLIERELMLAWERKNEDTYDLQFMINQAHREGLLPKWFGDTEVTPRDAAMVADVIQWLGTNCGLSFLSEAFKRAGYEFTYREKKSAHKMWERNRKRRQARMMARIKKEEMERSRHVSRVFDFGQ